MSVAFRNCLHIPLYACMISFFPSKKTIIVGAGWQQAWGSQAGRLIQVWSSSPYSYVSENWVSCVRILYTVVILVLFRKGEVEAVRKP